METLRASTPPPQRSTRVHTPEAPKHGFADNWAPYSPPRKSARLLERSTNHIHNVNRSNRTPSPEPDSRVQSTPLGSPRHSTRKSFAATPQANMTSASPQKKRQPKMDTLQRASSSSTAAKLSEAQSSSTTSRTMASAMGLLPTPAKTPQKAPSPKSKAKVQAIARNLFHPADSPEVMLSPRKRSKQLLDSFGINEDNDPFPIFTDSQDRIPEVDTSEENPFYVAPGAHVRATEPEAPRRRSKRQTVRVPGEGKVPIEEAVQRDDGMLIVFRGKKQFRKFAEMDDILDDEHGLDEADGGLDSAVESRRVTRSSVKPRLLFPAVQKQPSHSDEEAETDIEDNISAAHGEATDLEVQQTPLELVNDKMPDTPRAPKFAPVSPPTTMRTTRFGAKSAEEGSPMKSRGGKPRSPFDGWRRGKAGSDDGRTLNLKRSGDSLSAEDSKRTRV